MIDVRRARLKDVEAIADVHTRAWQVAYRGLMPVDFLDSLDSFSRAERWRQIMGNSHELGPEGLVAEVDGVVQGFCWSGPSRDEDAGNDWELYAVYVDPDRWRTGLGSALATEALRRRAQGTVWTVWSLASSEQSSAFYSRLGFRRDGSRVTRDFGGESLEVVRHCRRGIPPGSGD